MVCPDGRRCIENTCGNGYRVEGGNGPLNCVISQDPNPDGLFKNKQECINSISSHCTNNDDTISCKNTTITYNVPYDCTSFNINGIPIPGTETCKYRTEQQECRAGLCYTTGSSYCLPTGGIFGHKMKAGVILTEDVTAKNETNWNQFGTGWKDGICAKNNMYLVISPDLKNTKEYCCKSDDDQCLKSLGFPYVIKECSQ